MTAIDINDKFKLITDHWSPKAIGRINDYVIKLAKIKGDFLWHKHDETDELFIVHRGNLRIDFRDERIHLKPGQMYIVPKGVEHKPFAGRECEIILLEPESTINTGNLKNERTIEKIEWI
jgi:mannose-6-phosphate isomerase-like protein (cupin superfamily)